MIWMDLTICIPTHLALISANTPITNFDLNQMLTCNPFSMPFLSVHVQLSVFPCVCNHYKSLLVVPFVCLLVFFPRGDAYFAVLYIYLRRFGTKEESPKSNFFALTIRKRRGKRKKIILVWCRILIPGWVARMKPQRFLANKTEEDSVTKVSLVNTEVFLFFRPY